MNRLSALFLTLLMPLAVAAADQSSVSPEHVSTFSQPDLGQISIPAESPAAAAAVNATGVAEADPGTEGGSGFGWIAAILAAGVVAAFFAAYSSRPRTPHRAVAAGVYAERQRIMALGQDGEAAPPRRAVPPPVAPIMVDTGSAPVSTFDLYLARATLLARKGGGPGIG